MTSHITSVRVSRRDSLPAAGWYVGHLVVLSTTGVIYRWNGSAWVPDGSGGGGVSDGNKGDITVSSAGTVWSVNSAAVTLAKLANIAASRFLGRATAGAGVPEALTGTQATALLDSFTDAAKGLAPASGGGTTNFLRADGAWASAGGGGSPNLDGGTASSVFGGIATIDGGTA